MMFCDAIPESRKLFQARPHEGSRRNRGSALDLNLHDLETGEPTDVTGTHDEFSRRPFPNCPGGAARQRWLREPLRPATEVGRRHFGQGDRRGYALRNATVGQTGAR